LEHPFSDLFAKSLQIRRCGAPGINQKVGVHFGHLGTAALRAAHAGFVDNLPRL
jgi:hypothetical protein